ncbi:hypothetical protein BJ170DRAFT_397584 [Xylariales sp. AK1849]|nr:hypothetical protein BJ170DRAFT_397584 [Xylariales sp. AK1849]
MSVLRASFDFLQWQKLYETQKPYEVFLPISSFGKHQGTVPRTNLVFESKDVMVKDVRGQAETLSLDEQGFQFVKSRTMVDLKDREAVTQAYIPAMERLLQSHIGNGEPVRTFCFDVRLRETMDPSEFSKRTVDLEDGFDPLLPSTHPHVGSISGAIRQVQRHLGDEADELLKGRVRIINIWRPLHKVTAWPLALCDTRTVNPDSLIATDVVRRRYVGETYFCAFEDEQEWYYLSGQDVDEVALLKIYDSNPLTGARFCLHSSFPPKDNDVSKRRESIELRMLVFTGS